MTVQENEVGSFLAYELTIPDLQNFSSGKEGKGFTERETEEVDGPSSKRPRKHETQADLR